MFCWQSVIKMWLEPHHFFLCLIYASDYALLRNFNQPTCTLSPWEPYGFQLIFSKECVVYAWEGSAVGADGWRTFLSHSGFAIYFRSWIIIATKNKCPCTREHLGKEAHGKGTLWPISVLKNEKYATKTIHTSDRKSTTSESCLIFIPSVLSRSN